MANAGKRGAFIVFEGIDRCGKSTQSAKLLEHLKEKNVPVELWAFPDRSTGTGQCINKYLSLEIEIGDAAAVHMMFSANRWEKRNILRSVLESGTTLVCDRYSGSGIAYTAAKGVEDLSAEWYREKEKGLPAPDLVLYMKIDPHVSAKRKDFGEERYEKLEFQTKVAEIFDQMARDEGWRVIDATQPIELIQKQVAEAVGAVLERIAEGKPLGKLFDT